MRGQWNQGECFPPRSKVVTVGAMQCIHLGIGHSGIELGRKRVLMMDAIQEIVWGHWAFSGRAGEENER